MGCASPQSAGIPNIPPQHLNRVHMRIFSYYKWPRSGMPSTSIKNTSIWPELTSPGKWAQATGKFFCPYADVRVPRPHHQGGDGLQEEIVLG